MSEQMNKNYPRDSLLKTSTKILEIDNDYIIIFLEVIPLLHKFATFPNVRSHFLFTLQSFIHCDASQRQMPMKIPGC